VAVADDLGERGVVGVRPALDGEIDGGDVGGDIVPTHAGRELRRILLDYIQSAIERGELPPGVEPLT
ncbi:hypothetical protein ACWCO3_23310, partial [Micromonospora sp. NPDC002411]